jgi:drug/metabolite transporter (DMT)-like permease
MEKPHAAKPTIKPANRKHAWLVPLLCLIFGGGMLGISTNLAKLAGENGLSSLAFLSWSIFGAALMLMAIAAMRRNLPPVTRHTLEYYAVAALVGVAGPNLIFFSAIPHIGAGFVVLMITLPPLLTYLAALVFSMERFQIGRAAGVAAALAGAGVLAAHKFSAPDADVFWIMLALCGPVLLAIGNIYRTARWPEGVSADTLVPGMLTAAALMLPLAALLPGFSLAVPVDHPLPVLLIILQAVVFAGQFLLLFILQKTGGPVLLSLLGSVGAIVGVPVAVFLQGEAPPDGLFLGSVLIAAGVFLVTFGKTGVKADAHDHAVNS